MVSQNGWNNFLEEWNDTCQARTLLYSVNVSADDGCNQYLLGIWGPSLRPAWLHSARTNQSAESQLVTPRHNKLSHVTRHTWHVTRWCTLGTLGWPWPVGSGSLPATGPQHTVHRCTAASLRCFDAIDHCRRVCVLWVESWDSW